MSENPENWQGLLLDLFSEDMRNRWGWGKILRAAPGTHGAMVIAGARASIDTDGLDIPYYCGRITVDFDQRAVNCHAFDQKTPSDEYWNLSPDADWWRRAATCPWPMIKS